MACECLKITKVPKEFFGIISDIAVNVETNFTVFSFAGIRCLEIFFYFQNCSYPPYQWIILLILSVYCFLTSTEFNLKFDSCSTALNIVEDKKMCKGIPNKVDSIQNEK